MNLDYISNMEFEFYRTMIQNEKFRDKNKQLVVRSEKKQFRSFFMYNISNESIMRRAYYEYG